jgi:hypothetical protein
MRQRKRAIGILVAVFLAVALPACGNSGGKTNETKRAAGLVPKDALAYISLSIEPSDSQKSQIDGLLAKFPKASRKSFDGLKEDAVGMAVQKIGLDYQKDVKPWLGSELGIAVLPNTPQPNVVGLIKSKDDAQAKAALDKAAKSPKFDATYRIVNGYAVVVEKKQAALLDVITRQSQDTGTSLSAQDKFTRVVDQLTGDRLAVAWADGHALVELAKAQLARRGGKTNVNLSALPDLGSAALDLHAVSSGAVVAGLVETPGTTGGGDTKLTDGLPADSLGALSAFNLGGAFESVLGSVLAGNPQATRGLQQAQQSLGLDIRQDVLSWMHGETVIATGPPTTGTTPDFALLIQPTDRAKAQAAVTKIASLLEQRVGVKLDQRPGPGGSTMYVFPAAIRPGIQPAMALLSDRFILASNTEYLTKLAKGGGGFDSSKAFKDTLDSSKSGTQFQLVLQLSSIRRYIETLLTGTRKAQYERDVKPWVDHLSAAGMRVRKDGKVTRFEIKATVD